MTHPVFTLVTALLLAIGMSAVGKLKPRQRLSVATLIFLNCVLAVLAGSWAMLLIHG